VSIVIIMIWDSKLLVEADLPPVNSPPFSLINFRWGRLNLSAQDSRNPGAMFRNRLAVGAFEMAEPFRTRAGRTIHHSKTEGKT